MKRKLNIKMVIEEEKIKELTEILLNFDYHWMEIDIGTKEGKK